MIIDEVTRKPKVSFSELLEGYPTRIGLIFNFLAILELLALQVLTIQVGEGYNNFWILKGETTPAPTDTSSLNIKVFRIGDGNFIEEVAHLFRHQL